MHTGELRFICVECGHTSNINCILNNHIKKMHIIALCKAKNMKDLIQKVSLPKLGEDTTDFTEVDAELMHTYMNS